MKQGEAGITSPAGKPGLYSQLKAEITPMRRQGDAPERDPGSFSRFSCDLCRAAVPLTGLRQCALCGRWACSDCWTHEFYICHSCAGILRLLKMQAEGDGEDDAAATSLEGSPPE